MPPSGRRNSTLPLSQGEAVRFHGSMVSASPSSASDGLAVEASARPGALLMTPSSGSPTTVVALALPQPSMRCDRVEMRRRSLRRLLDRRPGGEARPQLDADMVLLLARLAEEGEGAPQIGVAGKHGQEARADVLQLHRRLAAALEDDRGPPGDAVLPERRRPARRRGAGPPGRDHIDRRIGVVAELDALAALRHRVGVEDLARGSAARAGSPPSAASRRPRGSAPSPGRPAGSAATPSRPSRDTSPRARPAAPRAARAPRRRRRARAAPRARAR